MLRRLKKALQKHKKKEEPLILFVPDESVKVNRFLTKQSDVITVTDRKIYKRVLSGVLDSLKKNRKGVSYSEARIK